MKRLVHVELVGVIIASLIFLVVIGLVEINEPGRSESAVPLVLDTVDPVAPHAVFDTPEYPDCEQAESQLAVQMDQSRSCVVDTDCTVVTFGCPFGCTSSISKTALEDLRRAEIAFQEQCHRCPYLCSEPLFEWRPTCVRRSAKAHKAPCSSC